MPLAYRNSKTYRNAYDYRGTIESGAMVGSAAAIAAATGTLRGKSYIVGSASALAEGILFWENPAEPFHFNVFPIPPNFSRVFELVEDHGGLAREAISTAEQRLGTFPTARYGFRFETMTLTARESGYFRKLLEGHIEYPFAVPFWPDKRKLTAATVLGTAFANCEDITDTFFDYGFTHALLWHDFDHWEAFRLFTWNTTQLQFDREITKAFVAGDFVIPLAIGHMKRPDSPALTDVNSVFPVDFKEIPIQVPVYLEETVASEDFGDFTAIGIEGLGGPEL